MKDGSKYRADKIILGRRFEYYDDEINENVPDITRSRNYLMVYKVSEWGKLIIKHPELVEEGTSKK